MPSLRPLICLVFTGLARDDLDLVGDHEDGVEADAELADEVGVLPGIAGELGEEVLCARAGDGAEVRDEVFLVHADAGIGDGEGLVSFVELEVDARRIDAIADESLVLLVGESKVAQLVERVGGVGDELAEKDLRVGVKGMDDRVARSWFTSVWNCCLDIASLIMARSGSEVKKGRAGVTGTEVRTLPL